MTALGLVVAIPATMAYNLLMLWLEDIICYYQLFPRVLVLVHQYDKSRVIFCRSVEQF